ncbi:MAG: alkaline phosphatase family protein [Acidimicrobiia bacterium]|nr:alkaline phosphatase family protein [Acidimicrobiia bacterium]
MTEDSLAPDYSGGALVNLVAELERRLTGSAHHPGLHPDLAAAIPEATSYVLMLFDGLGDHQLAHPAAGALRSSRVGAIDAGWPTTTTVSMATIATGMTPAEHGLLGYQLRVPETGHVVNTIKWITQWGEKIDHDLWGFLPMPNLWERLASHGVEPVTLQPWNFDDSPMSRMLYRGCRFEPWSDEDEAAAIAAQLAAVPGRLVFFYVPHVDFAAHVGGQGSDDYAEAMGIAARMWERLVHRLPAHAVAIGTADHGHVDIAEDHRIEIPKAAHDDRDFGGDPRAPFVYGEVAALAAELGVDWVPREQMESWWGPGTHHPGFDGRAPDGVLLPRPGWVAMHRHADERLVGHHGGLTPEEMRIPLLVAAGRTG